LELTGDAAGEFHAAHLPVGDGQLEGEQGGAGLVAGVADLEEVTPLGVAHRRHREVVDDEPIDAAELIEQLGVAAVGAVGG